MATAEKRQEFVDAIPAWYFGQLHWVLINVMSVGVIVYCLRHLEDPRWWEWAFIPAFFVFSNWFEWMVHRGPMHHPTRGARVLYQRHTIEHHVFFTNNDMGLRSGKELFYVLFAWWFLPAILVVNLPIPLLLGKFVSVNMAYFFFGSVFAYYLVYEWFHFVHHVPADTWLGRIGIIELVREHHTRHHELERMNKGNFNVSFPLWDWLLGSMLPEAQPAGQAIEA